MVPRVNYYHLWGPPSPPGPVRVILQVIGRVLTYNLCPPITLQVIGRVPRRVEADTIGSGEFSRRASSVGGFRRLTNRVFKWWCGVKNIPKAMQAVWWVASGVVSGLDATAACDFTRVVDFGGVVAEFPVQHAFSMEATFLTT